MAMHRVIFLTVLFALLGCDSNTPFDYGGEVIVRLNAAGDLAWVTKGEKEYIIDASSHPTARIDRDSVDIVDPAALNQANYPTGWVFPDELPAFTITNLSPAGGESLTVTITFPTAYPAGAAYYKATAQGFAPYAAAAISGNVVGLFLTDGGPGDSDAVNGQITDPGGPAICRSTGWAVGAATDGHGTILKTSDGGIHWFNQGDKAPVPDVTMAGVAAVDDKTVWVVGDFPGDYPAILFSTDGGQTWERQGEHDNLPQTGLMDVFALNREVAWAVGDGGTIIHTQDKGKSWHVQGAGQVPACAYQGVFALDDQRVWVTGGPAIDDGVIAYSQDGGETWQEYETQGDLNVYYFVPSILPSGTGWISGHDRVILHTTNYGQSWDAYRYEDLPLNIDFNNVVAINDQTAWIPADKGCILYTVDGSQTWNKQTPVSAAGFYLMGVAALDARHLWMVGVTSGGPADAGVIIHTRDGGKTWTRQPTPTNVGYWNVSFVK